MAIQAAIVAQSTTGMRLPNSAQLPLVCLTVALGTVGLELGLGTPPAMVAVRALCLGSVVTVAAGALIGVAFLFTKAANTTYLRRFVVDPAVVARYRLNGLDPDPTVFNVPAKLVANLRARTAGARRNLNYILLHGPAASGKTVTAQGIAHQLGARFVAVSAADLRAEDVVEGLPLGCFNFFTLVVQAIADAQKHRRPVVVFIDEAETVFGASPSNGDLEGLLHAAILMNTTNYLTWASWVKPDVTIVAATNHPQQIRLEPFRLGADSGFNSMFKTCHVAISGHTPKTREQLLPGLLRNLRENLQGCGIDLEIDSNALSSPWAQLACSGNFDGRDLQSSMARAQNTIESLQLLGSLSEQNLQQSALAAAYEELQERKRTRLATVRPPASTARQDDAFYFDEEKMKNMAKNFAASLRTLLSNSAVLQLDPARQLAVQQALERYNDAVDYLAGRTGGRLFAQAAQGA
jgi:hypothetical protein